MMAPKFRVDHVCLGDHCGDTLDGTVALLPLASLVATKDVYPVFMETYTIYEEQDTNSHKDRYTVSPRVHMHICLSDLSNLVY